jgi:Dockerin type I domain
MRLLVVFTMIITFLLPSVVFADKDCQGICGDANNDGMVNVSDAVWIINYVFQGGAEPQPVLACGDANSDSASALSDAVWIINYVFVGGDPPGDCSPGSPLWPDGDCCPFVPIR